MCTPSAPVSLREPQRVRPSWAVCPDDANTSLARDLATAFDLPLPLAVLLISRGIATPDAAGRFLEPLPEHLHDPHRMLGVAAAVTRLRAALAAGDPILIYGDYDVDGTVATVLLKTALERTAASLGIPADIRYHIPHRIREGYGMRESRLADAQTEGVRLVVSVDTGIRAFAAAAEAERLGLDLIVTDHHLPDSLGGVPRAIAVLNPNQAGCDYPYKELCGAGVAFKLAQALLESAVSDEGGHRRLREKTLPSFLKLLAIATVADAVPLTGENRVIAALGLAALRQPAQSGLRCLMELAGIDLSRPISASDVGFRLGPRINAAGRMDIASDVVELFLTRDLDKARALAGKLHALNDDRKATEARALAEIEAQLEALANDPAGLDACLVLDDTPESPWHRGVLGILASRVVDRTGHPALVLTHENGEAHGSGRSVAGFHLLDALTAAHAGGEPLFLRFGGHAHAAGFALPSHRVPELRDRLRSGTAGTLRSDGPGSFRCDAELPLAALGPRFFAAYERLGPWGNGHPEPIFLGRNLSLAGDLRLIKDKHLAFEVRGPEGGRPWRATAWSRRIDWPARARDLQLTRGCRFDLAFRLRRNWHPDFGGWELEIEELHMDAGEPVGAGEVLG